MYPDDLASIDGSAVEEEKVINILDQRYRRGNFHTFVGNMLLIINPNQEIKIYDDVVKKEIPKFFIQFFSFIYFKIDWCQYHERYKNKTLASEDPHVFAIVDTAWQDMQQSKRHQNIILAGDRQSGKTFCFNQIVRHLCYIARVICIT